MRKIVFIILFIVACGISRAQLFPADSNWIVQEAGTTELLKSVFFNDSLHGWIGGEQSIFQTTNGGDNWVKIDSTEEENKIIQDVFILDENHLWKITRKDTIIDTIGTNAYISKILFSNDNGFTWMQQYETTEHILEKIHFNDTLHGFVVGSGGIVLKTDTGGMSWNTTTTENVLLKSIFFLNDTIGWIAGEQSTVLNTIDGGNNWNIQQELPVYATINSIYFIDDQTGWLGGNVGRLFSTNDGGVSWTLHQFDYEDYFYDLYFKSDMIGWACSANGRLHYTTDGDTIWYMTEASEYNLRDMVFVDEDKGWIVGNNGLILHTSNGGGKVDISENIFKQNKLSAELFPNPLSKNSILEITTPVSGNLDIFLYDVKGKLLAKSNVIMNQDKIKKIRLSEIIQGISDFNQGLYFIKIHSNYDQLVLKMIK